MSPVATTRDSEVVTYYVNPDGSAAFTVEDESIGSFTTGGEVHEDAEEVTAQEYDQRLEDIETDGDATIATLVRDEADAVAAEKIVNDAVLAKVALVAGTTVDALKEALE